MGFFKRLVPPALVYGVALALAGCGTSNQTATQPTVESVAITPPSTNLNPGETQQLTVTATLSDGSTEPVTTGVTYTSSNAEIASVSASGLVTAGNVVGTANISASVVVDVNSALTTPTPAAIIVALAPPKLVSIALSPPTASVLPGASTQLTVTGVYSRGAPQPLPASGETFMSSNTAVATVDAAGLVTVAENATAGQTVTITATDKASGLATGANTSTVITVAAPPPTLVSIALSPLTATVAPGGTQQLSVVGTYSSGPTMTLAASGETFTSANTSIATVDAAGLVTVAAGATAGATVVITATDNASGLTTSTPNSTLITVGSASTTTGVLSTGFNSTGTTTTLGATGTWSAYFGGSDPTLAGGSGGGYADQGTSPSYEYVFVQDTIANLGTYTYEGVGIKPGSNQTVSAAGFNSLSFTLAVNAEWFQQGANFVVLITGNVSGVSTASCNPEVAAVVTATASAATAYTVPLTAFTTVVQNCGVGTVTPAQILAGTIEGVDFQADGLGAAITASGLTSNSNTTVAAAGSSPATYPTTVNVVGGVAFVNSGTPPATTTTGVMSTGFNSTGTTTTGITGVAGTYSAYFGGSDATLAGGSGGGYADQGTNPSYEYVFVQDTIANLGTYTYEGVGIKPGTGQTVSTSGFNSLSFMLAVNPEWFQQGANFVVLITGNVSGVSTASCNPQVAAVVTATASAATAYTVPLTAFTAVTQNCGVGTVTPAQILAAPIVGIDFQADGLGAAITASGLTSNSNTTVAAAGSSPATYPTTVNVVGGVAFVNASTPPATTTTGVMSTGFNSTGTTTTGITGVTGTYSAYFGGSDATLAGGSGGGYADQGTSPSYEYVFVQDTIANLGAYTYQGIGIKPGTGQTVSTSGFNHLSFTLAVNPEWFQQGANFVVLITGNVSGVSTASCNPEAAAVVTATGSAATAYTVPLSAFTAVVQNCGVGTVTTAQILAGTIVGIDFQADGLGAAITASGLTSNSNTTVAAAGSSPATYPTTVNVVGEVSFVP